MCGIVGYIGKNKNAIEVSLEGLKRLEYRGYDSAGIAAITASGSRPFFKKQAGKIAALEKKITSIPEATSAIAHTRWATHGVPTVKNAHPHTSCDKRFFVVHNGIIENHASLRKTLEKKSHTFTSDTDTEVLAHLIEEHMRANGSLADAVRKSLSLVSGTFGIAVLDKENPDMLVAARRGSPLLVGVGSGEYFVASDAAALVKHTRQVVYLHDDEMVELTPEGYEIRTFANKQLSKPVDRIEWDIEQSQKGGFAHFMQKEIHEAPDVIRNTIGGRSVSSEGEVMLGGLAPVAEKLRKVDRCIVLACGTSYYAALVGKYLFQEHAGIPVDVEYASEFRYHAPPLSRNVAVIAVSQSGETADTLEAVKEAKRKGALTLGIVNVVGSSIAREVDAGVYNHAGPEMAVASTKAFLSQLVVFVLMSIYLGRQRSLSAAEASRLLVELEGLPAKAEKILKNERAIRDVAKKYKRYENFLYLGRRYSWPVALEGALKLKEISYIHAEGYPAGEMKHGPLAVIEKTFPTMMLALRDSVYDKTLSNMQEIRARGGKIVAICTSGDRDIGKYATNTIPIPSVTESFAPLLSVIPLQLFAYHAAVLRGTDVDKPRNLAKSVTVE